MLLPSALSCDSSHSSRPPLTRLQSALFASPPVSPPQLSAHDAIDSIFSTCRSLQALLAAPAPLSGPSTPPTMHSQLPTPPMAHTPSPMKLRLRSHKSSDTTGLGISTDNPVKARKRIVKRSAPARGLNKRRREDDDDMGRDDEDIESDLEIMRHETPEMETPEELARPATPKRARIAPEVIPLGLERSDFHTLHANGGGLFGDDLAPQVEGSDVIVEADGEKWSTEDDRILVELVLEKLKLSKSDWQDCARSLGKDRSSLGRRWKSLMINGDVGLKRSSRRSKIHGTWR
ncbi:hypothetical protein CONLIGDRAFT_676181 [Coniochaeta ligniaria NRRL 30616]|uniref:Myb-like domain-containing protein n=1 Tax=Coniochaeta ligniaria NRRL 30616 TaxID=1408157 RepID=A0A1J7J538_9PEZI|nr:hypothetical protein CONLIGDRAFT_676181 [Coniochaeta ligniaria NRRL 30616]